MEKIGIFYGTSTGNTEIVADLLQECFGAEQVELFDVARATKDDVMRYSNLIFGTSTWGSGTMQDDFEEFIYTLERLDLSGKKIALYGLGDSSSYGDTFVDGIGVMYKRLKNADVVGFCSSTGYHFERSRAFIDGRFVGLPVDEDSEHDLTARRVAAWVDQLKKEFN